MANYKIVVETTGMKKSAQQRYNLITRNKINADIKTYKTDGGEIYSVEVGPYSGKKQVLQDVDKIKRLGIKNAFITSG
ncbi:SPOR domain-containing protein [Virgibacillus litoralis]|uniref:Cell division protein FtsN n=1 Tax=Virgibacillus litoralis TaxID=578221 RepID=A0ABS4HGA7_9BACI|nr:SPOR domain-containing protein [Virgibacillus litoralis]MBP1949957.1 cell division protein FtsN [Virgibacillus litoralis]